jgi:choline dehydrogenase-like flavoprotein
MASNEIIISAGALDTPKLLLLSGIGPKSELSNHNIECVHNLPGVGKNLQDHWWIPLTVQLKPGTDDRPTVLNDPVAMEAAKTEFKLKGTGPLAKLYGSLTMGWWRPSKELEASEEFKNLPADVVEHLSHTTVPTWELVTHTPPLSPLADPSQSYLTLLVVGQIPQSRGTVTLSSSNPQDAPISDPNLFSNDFDRRNLIEATRTAWGILTRPSLAKDTVEVFSAPKSLSDEDIWSYARETAATTW